MKCKKINHFSIYFNAGSVAEAEITDISKRLEASYKKIITDFQLEDNYPIIELYLYNSMAEKIKQTGEDGNAHTDRANYKVFAAYDNDVKPVGPHEFVHLLTNKFGWSNLVLAEGLAESFDDNWHVLIGKKLVAASHDEWTRRFIKDGTFISITKLYDDHKFWDYDYAVSYPECGSFMKYLRSNYSMAVIKKLLSSTTRRGELSENLAAFKKCTGKDLKEVESLWTNNLLGK